MQKLAQTLVVLGPLDGDDAMRRHGMVWLSAIATDMRCWDRLILALNIGMSAFALAVSR